MYTEQQLHIRTYVRRTTIAHTYFAKLSLLCLLVDFFQSVPHSLEGRSVLWLVLPALLHDLVDLIGTAAGTLHAIPLLHPVPRFIVGQSRIRNRPAGEHLPQQNAITPYITLSGVFAIIKSLQNRMDITIIVNATKNTDVFTTIHKTNKWIHNILLHLVLTIRKSQCILYIPLWNLHNAMQRPRKHSTVCIYDIRTHTYV